MSDILLEPPRVGVTADDEDGHYKVKTPDGAVKAHKRASDYTGLLDKNWALRRHEDRELARGVALEKSLIALARAHQHDGTQEDKRVFDQQIIPRARTLAGAGSKADIGNALHRNTEEVDRGTPLVALDPDWRPHLKAYADAMAAIPFTVDQDHIERVVILDGYRIAGKIDRVLTADRDINVTFPSGRKVTIAPGDKIIGDLKTGRWFTPLKWQIQCGIYAHHTATWHPCQADPDNAELGERGPMIGVRPDIALVVHLQAGIPAAPPEIRWLDLEAGYDAFLTAYEIDGHTKAADKGHCLFVDHLPSVFEQQAEAWCRARLAVVKTNTAAAACLTRMWPLRDTDDAPIPYRDRPTPEQTATLLNLLDRIEAEYGLPFTPQPGTKGSATQPTQETPTNPGEPK